MIPKKNNISILLMGLLLNCFINLSHASNTVAVLDFSEENSAAKNSGWNTGLEDFFEMALERQNVSVLERRNIRLVLGERDLQAHGLLSAKTLSQARLPSVSYFVSGNLSCPASDEFVLTLSVIRADNATLKASFTQHGNYPADWLPAIETLAKEVSARLQLPKREHVERSEFEEMTWIPEAALPFFKGLDYFSRGNYAAAVPWFRESYGKERHFDLARQWEARAYQKLDLPQLASGLSLSETNRFGSLPKSIRPVVAVIASGKISVSERAAFVQALSDNDEFDLFDPSAIGATAREIDLQLTGQMAAPLNDRSVWLVVDDLIYLDAPGSGTMVAREQNLLSGQLVRQAQVQTVHADDVDGHALAEAFLKSKKTSAATSAINHGEQNLPEPRRTEPRETALPRALRLVQAEPDDVRRWIGLADCYGDHQFKVICLEEAIKVIEHNRKQPDAAFWLASALWRQREMSRRIFYEPAACYRAPNSLTNDFARLLKWFPHSPEVAALIEVTNYGEGSYTIVEPADRRYLAAVYTNLNYAGQISGSPGTPVTPKVTDALRLTRLNEYLQNGRNARAWQLANILRASTNDLIKAQVQPAYQQLLQTMVREREQFRDFTSVLAAGNAPQALELGRELLTCIDRRQRAEVIKQCAETIKKEKGVRGQLQFLLTQARQYRDDFLLDPVTGQPDNADEYQLLDNTTNLVTHVVYGRDYFYEPLMGTVAETTHDQPPSNLTREILNYIHGDPVLPQEKRLTAAYDLAMLEQSEGNTFEALDQLRDVLRQTEGTGLPLRRNNSWSQSIESAAFDALRKIRVYSSAEMDICDCCGKIPDEAPQKPANFEETNRKLDQLWKQMIGEAKTNQPPVKQQLLSDKENFLPVILYKLRMDQEVSHTLIFCADLGTNALPALPVILQIIHRGEPFQDYNNALMALGALGPAAGCAKPLLILARENADNGNFKYAFKSIGPAPRRVMPQLAQLLYHNDPAICQLAALAMVETSGMDRKQFENVSAERLVATIREWWENAGMQQSWQ